MPTGILPDETRTSEDGFRPEAIKAHLIRKVYDHWLEKCGDQPMPLCEDIDILDLEFAVGALSLIDVIDPGSAEPRFFLRMIGSEIVAQHGPDNTGKYVDELVEATRNILQGSYSAALKNSEPFWIERRTFIDDFIYVYECLILPLRNENGEISRLLTILDWPTPITSD